MSGQNHQPMNRKITAVAMLLTVLFCVGCENKLESAKKLWQENNQDQAISKLKEELTKNPGNADAAKLLEVYQTEVDQQNLEKIAKEILETKIAGQSEGMVKLVDFEKTNGIKQSFNGMEFYTLEYSATVEFQQEVWKECDPFQGCFGNFNFRNVAPRGMEAAVLSFKHFTTGSKVKTAGKMNFQKTEKGWRGN